MLQREAEEEYQTGIFDVKAERVDTKSNEAQAMELEAQMFKAESSRARQIWRENDIKDELVEAEEREKRGDIKVGEHVRLLGEKRLGFTTLV